MSQERVSEKLNIISKDSTRHCYNTKFTMPSDQKNNSPDHLVSCPHDVLPFRRAQVVSIAGRYLPAPRTNDG
jgi:hypothetical protein